MADEFARNLLDGSLSGTFGLSATTGTATKSSTIDTGDDSTNEAAVEFELIVPALSNTYVKEGADVTIAMEASTTSTFASMTTFAFAKVVASTVGAVTATLRGKQPSNAGRYVRASVVINSVGTTGGASAAALSATFRPRF